jgi:GH15 family glucan-1,4-alpha-glucosidase
VPRGEQELDLAGYRGSRPVRLGNAAADQIQHDSYGDLLETVWLYVRDGNALDPQTQQRLAGVVDFVCRTWRNPDAGIWELREGKQHYVESKMSAWAALDRALRLVEAGELPGDHADVWRTEAAEIEAWIEHHGWSERKRTYVFHENSAELDASVLRAARLEFGDTAGERLAGTIDAVRRELSAGGPLLYRYSGMSSQEGAFLACSFWLVEALARAGRLEEASETMDATLALANDVGLYSEQIDPGTHELLGNFPQGLTHLALVNAATCFHNEERRPT